MYLKNLNLFKMGQHPSSSFTSILKIGQFRGEVPMVVPRKPGTFSPEALEPDLYNLDLNLLKSKNLLTLVKRLGALVLCVSRP
jgi:hypothetical protein